MKRNIDEKIDFSKRDKRDDKSKKAMVESKKKNSSQGSKKTNKPSSNAPKKRGRRPKKILDNDATFAKSTDSRENQSAVILKLKIKPEELEMAKKKSLKKQTKVSSEELSDESETSESDQMFNNDIPDDKVCGKCSKLEKQLEKTKIQLDKYDKRERMDKSNKLRGTNLNLIDENKKKVTIKKTNIKCWWDCESFSNLPSFLVDFYHDNTYHVRGCFCSVNCALAYNAFYLRDSKISERKSLTLKMHREMYDLSIDDSADIKEAPPRETLADFSGEGGLSIEEFRKTFLRMKREYILFMPPMKPITMHIEERNADSENIDDKKYILKRNKPLSKKRSIVSSMKMNINDDDSDND